MDSEKMKKAGPLLVMLSGVLFSFGGLLIKSIPWNPLSINAGRNLIAALITFVFIKLSGQKIVLNKTVFISGLTMAFTTTGFCIANKMTTAANAILLQFTSPVFVILFCYLFWKQRPTKRDLGMCACVFLGIVCFFYESITRGDVLGDLLALATGVTYAVVFICNRMKGGNAASTFLVGEIMSAAIGLPFLLQETQMSPLIIGSILLFGFNLGAGYVLVSLGLRHIKPVQANLISAVEPVLNPVWVALFYHETMSGLAIAGFIIVLTSVIAFNMKKAKPEEAGVT